MAFDKVPRDPKTGGIIRPPPGGFVIGGGTPTVAEAVSASSSGAPVTRSNMTSQQMQIKSTLEAQGKSVSFTAEGHLRVVERDGRITIIPKGTTRSITTPESAKVNVPSTLVEERERVSRERGATERQRLIIQTLTRQGKEVIVTGSGDLRVKEPDGRTTVIPRYGKGTSATVPKGARVNVPTLMLRGRDREFKEKKGITQTQQPNTLFGLLRGDKNGIDVVQSRKADGGDNTIWGGLVSSAKDTLKPKEGKRTSFLKELRKSAEDPEVRYRFTEVVEGGKEMLVSPIKGMYKVVTKAESPASPTFSYSIVAKPQPGTGKPLIYDPDVQSTAIVGGLVGLGAVSSLAGGLAATGAIGFSAGSFAKDPTWRKGGGLLTMTVLGAKPALVPFKEVFIRVGSTKVAPELIFSPDVLSGKQTLPTAKSVPDIMTSFEATGKTPKGTVDYTPADMLSFEMKGIGIDATKTIKFKPPKFDIEASTVSDAFLKGDIAAPGKKAGLGLEDPGIYVTPKGQASPYFTRIPEAVPPKGIDFSIGGFLDLPTVTEFSGIKSISRQPGKVVKQPGFEAVGTFLSEAGAKQKADIFVTKRTQIGFGELQRQKFTEPIAGKRIGEMATTEMEAIIPPGQKLNLKEPTTFLGKLKGFDEYTTFKGRAVAIRKIDLVSEGRGMGVETKLPSSKIAREGRAVREVMTGKKGSSLISRPRSISSALLSELKSPVSSKLSSAYSTPSSSVSRGYSQPQSQLSSLSSPISSKVSQVSRPASSTSYSTSRLSSNLSSNVSRLSRLTGSSRGYSKITGITTPPPPTKFHFDISKKEKKKESNIFKTPTYKQPKRYTPTLHAVVGQIHGKSTIPKLDKMKFSGLEARPILSKVATHKGKRKKLAPLPYNNIRKKRGKFIF